MSIEETYLKVDETRYQLFEKQIQARIIAKKAYKKGDMKKWDKFNAVARAYRMQWSILSDIANDLLMQTPPEFRNAQIPF